MLTTDGDCPHGTEHVLEAPEDRPDERKLPPRPNALRVPPRNESYVSYRLRTPSCPQPNVLLFACLRFSDVSRDSVRHPCHPRGRVGKIDSSDTRHRHRTASRISSPQPLSGSEGTSESRVRHEAYAYLGVWTPETASETLHSPSIIFNLHSYV
jgi:hypothetical protein